MVSSLLCFRSGLELGSGAVRRDGVSTREGLPIVSHKVDHPISAALNADVLALIDQHLIAVRDAELQSPGEPLRPDCIHQNADRNHRQDLENNGDIHWDSHARDCSTPVLL